MNTIPYQYFTGKFEGAEKKILFYQSWRPVFCEKVLVIVHGLGEHSGRYQTVVDTFTQEGFAVYGYDHRGHGRSSGQRGYVKRFSELTDDLRHFLKLVMVHESDRPIYIFGHSLGGLISLRYLVDCENKSGVVPQALLLSNPTIKIKVQAPEWKLKLADIFAVWVPRLSMYNELDLHYLSHDKQVIEEMMKDQLCHQRITARFYKEMIHAIEVVLDNIDMLQVPLLFLLGGEDGIIDPRGAQTLFEKCDVPKKMLKLYPTLYHELIHETDKEKVLNDMKQWVKSLKQAS